MTFTLLLSMSAFALAASISPGPVNLTCLSSGARYPISRGLRFVTGATLGFIVLFLAIGLGLLAVMEQMPGFEKILTTAGIAFLLYLSYGLFRDDGVLDEAGTQSAPGFWAGALMQWLNPKAWLATASAVGVLLGRRRSVSQRTGSPTRRVKDTESDIGGITGRQLSLSIIQW